RVIAEVRDLDAGGAASLERVEGARHDDGSPVDGDLDVGHQEWRPSALSAATRGVRSSDAGSSKPGSFDFARYASNSARNFATPERTGAIAASEKTQIVIP